MMGSVESSLHALMNIKSKSKQSSINKKLLRKKKTHRVSFFIKKKTDNIDAILQMRIPILGSAAVKARSEVYQDLLDLQIKASSGQSYSNTIFVGRRSGDVDVHRVDSSEDEDEDCGLEDVHVMLGLCSLLRTLCKERSYNSDKNGVRYKLRFQLFQHLIGLDERW